MPPINSLIKELDFVIANKEPIYISFVKIFGEFESIEKMINNIKLIKDCIISKDINDLIHVLKNQAVELFIKLKIANGEISIKTLTRTYLRD